MTTKKEDLAIRSQLTNDYLSECGKAIQIGQDASGYYIHLMDKTPKGLKQIDTLEYGLSFKEADASLRSMNKIAGLMKYQCKK